MHIFSERLQGLMEGRFTQQELADEMGVSQPTVQRWVSGAMPRGKRLERLASALGVTVKELFAYGPSEPGSSGMELRERARPELDEVLSELAQIEEHVKRIRKKVQEMK